MYNVFSGQNKQSVNETELHVCKLCTKKFPYKYGQCPQCNLPISEHVRSYDMNKTLIELAVEKALLKMGHPELELVKSRLRDDYDCEISDCLEYPEYIKTILCDLFGNCHYDIVESIHITLQKISMEKPITNFLSVINVHA
ncbi:MAG: hypothetical protein HW410_1162 [Nitrosarchaeum sp.]|nr:hypothetical protein [Nitrosarchaeum sp.]